MTSWAGFHAEAPELATEIRGRFEAHLHHVLATLRRDGSPRVSGTEVRWFRDDVWLGSMPASWKGRDLRRDPRCALHSAPIDTEMVGGDARLGARAVEVTNPATIGGFLAELDHPATPDAAELFRLDLVDATLVRVHGDRLHVDSWRPGRGVHHVERT